MCFLTIHAAFDRRRLRAAVLAVALLGGPDIASASLPVFGGFSFNPVTGTGYIDAVITGSPASCITNEGFAIGEAIYRTPAISNGGSRPVEWRPDGVMLPFNIGPPVNGQASGHVGGVNEKEVAVGDLHYNDSNGVDHGDYALHFADFITQYESLGISPASYGVTVAHAINNYDTSVGTSTKYVSGTPRGTRAVRWKPNSIQVTELPSLAAQSFSGYVESEAVDLNDNNVAVGYSGLYDGNDFIGHRAIRWSATGVLTQLGTIGTDGQGTTSVKAIGINSAGVVAASGNKYDANHNLLGVRGVRYDANSTAAIELGVLGSGSGGVSGAEVRSISDGGLILGASRQYFGTAQIGTRAVYWLTNGTFANELPNLGLSGGFTTGRANAANHDNVITGFYDKYVGSVLVGRKAVIWTTAGVDAVIDLNTLLPANTPWVLNEAVGISDTGFVSGIGTYQPSNGSSYTRHFSMLIPQAGTYGKGDASLDTVVNFDDLVILAQNYNKPNAALSVYVGDLNLDGVVNFDDLVPLAQNYNKNFATSAALPFSSDFAADWELAQSLVPEPGVTIFAAASTLLLYRRR